jgi:hypothetical protein
MMQNSTRLVAGAVALALTTGFVSPALAGGGASAAAPGKNKEALIAYYTYVEPTGSPTPSGDIKNLGGAISGGFYGNTSNAGSDIDAPASGHGVTPSISPGPQTLTSGGPGTGTSIGEVLQSAH